MHLRPHALNGLILEALHSSCPDHMIDYPELYYPLRQAGVCRWLTEHHVTRSSARIHNIMNNPFHFTPPDFVAQHTIGGDEDDERLGYATGVFRTENISIPLQIEHTSVVGSADYPYVYLAYSFDNNDHLAFEITTEEAATLNLILRKRPDTLYLDPGNELPEITRSQHTANSIRHIYHYMMLRQIQMIQPIRTTILEMPWGYIALPIPCPKSVTYRDELLDRLSTAVSVQYDFGIRPPDLCMREAIIIDSQAMPHFRFLRPGCPTRKIRQLPIVEAAIYRQDEIHTGYITSEGRCLAVTAIRQSSDNRWVILLQPREPDTTDPVKMMTTDNHIIIDITTPEKQTGKRPPRTADNPHCIREQARRYMAADYTTPIARILLDMAVEQGGSPDQIAAYINAWLNQMVVP